MSCIINAVTLRPLVEYPVAADSLAFIVTYYVMETGRAKILQSCEPTGARAHKQTLLPVLSLLKGMDQ